MESARPSATAGFSEGREKSVRTGEERGKRGTWRNATIELEGIGGGEKRSIHREILFNHTSVLATRDKFRQREKRTKNTLHFNQDNVYETEREF